MSWTALLLLALVLSPIVVAVGVVANLHVTKPNGSANSPFRAEQPVLRDPIDTDGPGATFSGGSR